MWSKERSKSKLISFFRNQVVSEFDGTRLYKHLPDCNSVESIDYYVRKFAKQCEYEKFYAMLQKNYDRKVFPVMSTIHEYLKSVDADWYCKQPALQDS